ncbi:hypothetical protein WA026_006346, partial [Henosepilachna vigintioctopunctata]
DVWNPKTLYSRWEDIPTLTYTVDNEQLTQIEDSLMTDDVSSMLFLRNISNGGQTPEETSSRALNSLLTSLKATKYIPSTYEVNVSGDGDTDIPRKNNHSVGHNKSNSAKRNAVYPEYHVQIKSRSAKYKSVKYINYKLSTKFLSWIFVFLLASLFIVLIV